MPGIACLQHRNVPRALTAKTFSHTSSGVSGALVVEPTPATLTSTSRSPIAAATASSSRTSSASGSRPRAELAGQRLHALAGRVGQHHVGALGVQGARDRLPDPRPGAGDERAPALEASVGHQSRYDTVSRAPDSAERTIASHTSAAR